VSSDISQPLIARNEFAAASLELVDRGSFSYLVITDMASGVTISLDAFELQSLAWARHEQLAEIVEPDNRLKAPTRAARHQPHDGLSSGEGKQRQHDTATPRS
jgi:hypothetical protein